MRFQFKTTRNAYTIETLVRVKNEDEIVEVDTAPILGNRYVSGYHVENGKQIVSFRESGGVFNQSLVVKEGRAIKLVLDRANKILNPYLTVNNWSLREVSRVGGSIAVSAVIYPGDISDLPDDILIVDNKSASSNTSTRSPSANSPSSNEGIVMIAAAGLLATAVSSQTRNKASSDTSDNDITYSSRIFKRHRNDDVVSRLRSRID